MPPSGGDGSVGSDAGSGVAAVPTGTGRKDFGGPGSMALGGCGRVSGNPGPAACAWTTVVAGAGS